MNKYDACKILSISGLITKEIVKTARNEAAKKYHPDMGGSVEMMQMVNEAYETLIILPEETIEIKEEQMKYGEMLNDAINAILHLSEIEIEICGSWIWVGGKTKQYKEVLKAADYKFAGKKKKWYFRPAGYKSYNRGKWSMGQIRNHYGSKDVETKPLAKLAS